ncbi:MAG: peptide chain release factor N(5)-glutamine methyltransferase [Rhodomicrobium sp.]
MKGDANNSGELREALRSVSRNFRAASIKTPDLDARILAGAACRLEPEEVIANPERRMAPLESHRLMQFAARRLAGEPVSRILGRREFWGLSFKVTSDTLDPRPATELLVEAVICHAKANGLAESTLKILDLGTGSGCILGAVLSELPAARGVGVDISFAALEVARENLRGLGLCDRSSFLCGDWAAALGSEVCDVIISNPPYIASSEVQTLEIGVRGYDPHGALDGGVDGLVAYRAILPRATKALRPGGLLLLEAGMRQAKKVSNMMLGIESCTGFSTVKTLSDLAGLGRAVAGVRQS